MKNSIKKRVFALILIGSIVYILFIVYNNYSDLQNLKIANPIFLIIAIIIYLGIHPANGLINYYILKQYNSQISRRNIIGITLVSSYYNIISPFSGGAITRAYYLKKKYSINIKSFLGSFIMLYLIVFLSGSVLGIISATILSKGNLTESFPILILFSLVMILCGIGIFIPKKFLIWINDKTFGIAKINKLLSELQNNKYNLVNSSVFSIITLFLNAGVFLLLLNALGIQSGFWIAIFYAAINRLALLLNLTPGAIGIKEGLMTGFGEILLGQGIEALSISVIDRVINYSILLLFGPYLNIKLFKNLRGKNDK